MKGEERGGFGFLVRMLIGVLVCVMGFRMCGLRLAFELSAKQKLEHRDKKKVRDPYP